jgi:hypothetical protein
MLVATITVFSLGSTAHALPSLNPHNHVLVGFVDPAAGGAGVNHHHWDPAFPLYPGNGVVSDETNNSPAASVGDPFVNVSFDAYSAWDQRGNQALYRNGDTLFAPVPANAVLNFGHGFIRQSVPYRFEGGAGGVPAAAIADFNAAIGNWVGSATAACAINAFCNTPNRVFGMNFAPGAAEDVNFNGTLDVGEDANLNGALDGFTVTWSAAALPTVRARWRPGRQELEFDSTENWFFGGAGAIPVGMTDFYTIAMHEIGHMIGLNHIDTGVAGRLMRSDIDVVATPAAAGTMGLRAPDVGSLFGTMALYVQPIPEPGTGLLAGMAAVMLGCCGARRRKRA